MGTRSGKKPLALYLHIPFCAAKCAYCDFASYPGREDVWQRYTDALADELQSWKSVLAGYEVRTVFFGGGTPSLLPAERIVRLMDGIRDCAVVCPDVEITLEANPGTLTEEKLRLYREAGINRLSLGAQAMDDRLLRALGRIHTVRQVAEAVSLARRAGFDNLSLDLMYGLPEQTMGDWKRTLDAAAALEPEHLSAYSLIVEEGTPLAQRAERGEISVPDDDLATDMQHEAVERLAGHGYARYEISNYAKADRECRHNIVYWERGEYLGLGCAAHSLMQGQRFENPRSLEEYFSGARKQSIVSLTRENAMEEMLMLSTRMCRGMDLAQYEQLFGVNFEQKHEHTLRRLEGYGLVERSEGFLRLTQRGLEVQSAVVVALLEDE